MEGRHVRVLDAVDPVHLLDDELGVHNELGLALAEFYHLGDRGDQPAVLGIVVGVDAEELRVLVDDLPIPDDDYREGGGSGVTAGQQLPGHLVLAVDEEHLGVYRLVHELVGHYDHEVALVAEMRGGAVDRDDTAAPLPGEGVSLEAVAVVHVGDCHLLADPDPGALQEVLVDGYAAFVVDAGLGDGGPVDLGAEHPAHGAGVGGLR